MKPESITVSLAWAEKLKEVGWPQDGHFWWYNEGKSVWVIGDTADAWNMAVARESSTDASFNRLDTISAPTAEEILRRLPMFLEEPPLFKDGVGRKGKLTILPNATNEWIVTYVDQSGNRMTAMIDSLANAAAAMWVYLAEHKLL